MSQITILPRAGQRAFEMGVEQHRICAFLTRRQYGKTTNAARIALKKMMRTPGHDVVFGSVKLDLGREIVRKESFALRQAFAALSAEATQARAMLDVFDATTGKNVVQVSADDFADLYETSKLEFRLYHSPSVYSRTKVVALTPDAVGETGDLILDEVGRVKKFREVWEAVKPIIASNRTFRCILTTTPPPDDTHYSFELLAPPIGLDFPVNPEGNWYRSELGVWVLRVTADDAHADGVLLYDDDTGEPITPAESRARDPDKDAWDRNYGVKFVMGGSSACSLLSLHSAQARGPGQAEFFAVEEESDLDRALAWITDNLADGPVGLGLDVATTEKETSNPTAVTILERRGSDYVAVAIVVWKTVEDDLAEERIGRLLDAVAAREQGGRARRLCVDATNEKYFARRILRMFRARCPVELVVASETIDAGGEPMTMKQFLGNQLVAELDDNHLTLPASRYVREDWRLVRKDRGSFHCEADAQGRHGDTFDSTKLALRALASPRGGPCQARAVGVRSHDLDAIISL